jgi:hypothetical protein
MRERRWAPDVFAALVIAGVFTAKASLQDSGAAPAPEEISPGVVSVTFFLAFAATLAVGRGWRALRRGWAE